MVEAEHCSLLTEELPNPISSFIIKSERWRPVFLQ